MLLKTKGRIPETREPRKASPLLATGTFLVADYYWELFCL